jgi:hypothetical protein
MQGLWHAGANAKLLADVHVLLGQVGSRATCGGAVEARTISTIFKYIVFVVAAAAQEPSSHATGGKIFRSSRRACFASSSLCVRFGALEGPRRGLGKLSRTSVSFLFPHDALEVQHNRPHAKPARPPLHLRVGAPLQVEPSRAIQQAAKACTVRWRFALYKHGMKPLRA